jgi:thiamine-monophosphate kinase
MMADDRKPVGGEGLGEFEIIARYFAPLATDAAALGLRDDAAVLVVTEGYELIATCDTLIEGVHFLPDDPPETIGYKSLAVNLSDLAAKGARGHAYLLSLAVPRETPGAWFEAFASGLSELQEAAKIGLVGGDTTATPGPLTITITALGLVAHGHAVLRHGAKSGNRLYVSGTIGDACLGLRLLKDPALARSWELTNEEHAFLVDRYRRPTPRMQLVIPVRNFAQGAIDVSDGLVGDIEKLAQASHVGAAIEAEKVPLSPAARKALARQPDLLSTLLTAGDDYEIVAAVPESSAQDFEAEANNKQVAVTAIGRLTGQTGEVRVLRPDGEPLMLDRKGYAHF